MATLNSHAETTLHYVQLNKIILTGTSINDFNFAKQL